MRAVLIEDGKIAYGETTEPVLGDEEVLVQVASAGINAADLLQVAGKYPPPAGIRSDIPGLEFAGTAIAQGSRVAEALVGKRVMAIVGGAAQGEFVSVHHSHLIEIPAQVDLLDAGAIPEAFLTAYDALWSQGNMTLGYRVLINGASGGVGSAAVALSVAAGAETFGTSRSPTGRRYIESLGATGLDPQEITGAGPFDIVVELVGGRNFPATLAELRSRGTIVIIGVSDMAQTELNMRLVMAKRAIIRGSTLRARSQSEKAEITRTFSERIAPYFSRGILKPQISMIYPASEAPQAYSDFANLPKNGKLLLQFSASN